MKNYPLNRARDFSELIKLLRLLKDVEFKPSIKDLIIPIHLETLENVRKTGNYTIHDGVRKITREYVKEKKDKIALVIEALLAYYKGENITIVDERIKSYSQKIRYES